NCKLQNQHLKLCTKARREFHRRLGTLQRISVEVPTPRFLSRVTLKHSIPWCTASLQADA
ncbi:unnamed protein product, partial [Microthlaspi erraticum]